MKNILTICFCLLIGQSYSQEKSIEIDYLVDYSVPSKRNNTIDTVSIGFNKDGKYLWTNYNKLVLNLAKSLLKNSSEDYTKAETNLILNTEEGILTLIFELKDNIIFFKLDIDSFLPNNGNDDNLDLITQVSDEKITVLEKEVAVYNIFPKNNPKDVLSIAVDKTINVNNNLIFKKFFEIAFQKSGLKDNTFPNVPNGLIMTLSDKNKTLIEATKVDKNKRTIKFNYNFKITE